MFSDVETVKCLPRAGGAHLLLTSFSAHLFVDADGFCGQSRGWAAEALSTAARSSSVRNGARRAERAAAAEYDVSAVSWPSAVSSMGYLDRGSRRERLCAVDDQCPASGRIRARRGKAPAVCAGFRAAGQVNCK